MIAVQDLTSTLDSEMIEKLLEQRHFTTCTPKENLKPESLRRILGSVGRLMTVLDEKRRPRCNVRVTEAYETCFGAPCPRFLAAMGYGEDIERFRRDYTAFWEKHIQTGPLTPATILVVESYELEWPRTDEPLNSSR